jgi:large conductance mechanosensitive channel
MWNDFKAFVMRGNVMDLAVGVIIGAAFGAIVKSLVDDILMPPLGLVTGGLDFSNQFVLLKEGVKAPPPYATPAAAHDAGAVTLNYGLFLNNAVAFVIMALAIFIHEGVPLLHDDRVAPGQPLPPLHVGADPGPDGLGPRPEKEVSRNR